MLMAMLACTAEKSDSRGSDAGEETPVSRIEPELFTLGDAVAGCSCLMRPAGETTEQGKYIYAEQVGTPEVRFVLMQWDGQLLRFAVDSSRYDNDARLRETRFSGNGYIGRAAFKEIKRTEPEVAIVSGSIIINAVNSAEPALTLAVEGVCGC